MTALKPPPMEDLIAVVDSREKERYGLSSMQSVVGALASADYSILGATDLIALERKTLPDLVMCCGPERDRFIRELQRLKSYPFRAIVIEADWGQLERGEYRSQINPKSVCHSIISWQARYCLPFHFAGDRQAAERYAAQFLYRSALRIWERGQIFCREVSA